MNRASRSVHTAATAFAQRLDRTMKNEAGVARRQQTRTVLKIATAPLAIALAAALAAIVLLIIWSPAFVETRRGDICFGRVLLWSAGVGVAAFAAPIIVQSIRSRARPKAAEALMIDNDNDDNDDNDNFE